MANASPSPLPIDSPPSVVADVDVPRSQRAHFLPHIQGLRAIAVLLVVLYHFWPGRLQGGYIGVDVFFVISGFLITSHLVRELTAANRISLRNFYAKRLRRLLPASILVLVVSSAALLLVMPLASLPVNVSEILASTFYIENWVLAFNSVDYLAAGENESLVQHYWSLSLEEQFYLIWPWLLLLGSAIGVKYARRNQMIVWVIVLASAASLALSIYMTAVHPAPAYFVTFTRIWEFGGGALLSFLMVRWLPGPALSNLFGFVGIIAILATGYLFTAQTPFPGYMALIPVLGTMAVILAHHRAHPWDAGRILSWRPIAFVGDISYSLYLWHWPLIIMAPFLPFWGLSFAHRVALLGICFVLAWLTKKFVEDPGRTWNYLVSRPPRVTFGWALALMGISAGAVLGVWAVRAPAYEEESNLLAATVADPPACFGAAAGRSDGTGLKKACINPALADVIIPNPGFGSADAPTQTECLTTLNDATVNVCEFGATGPKAPTVALVGDSHAYAMIDAFIRMAEDNGWRLQTYLKGGCSWSDAEIQGRGSFVTSCQEWRQGLAGKLAANAADIDVIFTAAKDDQNLTSEEQAEGFVAAWAPIAQQGVPIVTMADNPRWEDDPNKCLRTSNPDFCTVPQTQALPDPDPLVSAANQLRKQGFDAVALDFTPTFCVDGDCLSVIGGADVYRDADHLTMTFANTMIPFIQPSLDRAIRG